MGLLHKSKELKVFQSSENDHNKLNQNFEYMNLVLLKTYKKQTIQG